MSGSVRDYIQKDPFHQTKHIGKFVEKHFGFLDKTLTYQQRARVKSQARSDHFGTTSWQYSTLLSRLEIIKNNDPESVILLKVFADNLPESYCQGSHEDFSQVSDLTSVDGKNYRHILS